MSTFAVERVVRTGAGPITRDCVEFERRRVGPLQSREALSLIRFHSATRLAVAPRAVMLAVWNGQTSPCPYVANERGRLLGSDRRAHPYRSPPSGAGRAR